MQTAGGPIDRDLFASGITDKDLEIEHLQTQIVAFTEKLDVIDDMRKDVQASKDMYDDSEARRQDL